MTTIRDPTDEGGRGSTPALQRDFDPNLLPSHLLTLVMVGFNKNAFKPQIAAIKDKYYEMFRNKSKS